MKKYLLGLFLLSGCATAPLSTSSEDSPSSVTMTGGKPVPQVVPENPLEPREGESRQDFLERQIENINAEITRLEPKVIEATNRMDPAGEPEAQRLREQLFSLERQKANLELQILSLP